MYDNSCAKIVVNNTLCEEIKIKSGLKQGCALSMLLYIMCIEELIVRIKKNTHINIHWQKLKGIWLSFYSQFMRILVSVSFKTIEYFEFMRIFVSFAFKNYWVIWVYEDIGIFCLQKQSSILSLWGNVNFFSNILIKSKYSIVFQENKR